ncbi:MAG: hypothetical protein KAR42_07340 [candidate division Zixibacteria bacterium]|nr:hypothetical protein [candidate division Zixibacteria bacterium]
MINKRIILSGVAAGVICHFMQSSGAYLFFDRYYLESPDIVRDSTYLVGVYYLLLNLLVGQVVAHLACYLKSVWEAPGWQIGIRAGLILWAASSPVWIIKRQILLKLSNWLLLEIVFDLAVYIIIGAIAGLITGRLTAESNEE